jgi:hypothetical protein
MLGEVANFSAYRLTIARHDGRQQTIDLKNGTLIYPTGATPTQGERAAWSVTTATERSSQTASFFTRRITTR